MARAFAVLRAALAALADKFPARLRNDVRARLGAGGIAFALVSAAVLFVLTDPSRAYAVARIELPAMPRMASHAPPLGVDSPTASRPAPRPTLRATPADPPSRLASAEHGRAAPDHSSVNTHGESHGAGGASDARAATPTRSDGHGGPSGDGLAPAPIEALARMGPGGLLPRIGSDGRTPADAYARPFRDEAGAPLIAAVIGGLGLNAAVTREAIDSLPPDVTLSFVPYADGLQDWIDAARAAGHEVILELPMEPYDYPANDPGPHTLLARADPVENLRRLEWLMSRATGYFGVMNYLGARYTAETGALAPTLDAIAGMGVAFLYDGETRRADLDRLAVEAGLELAAADRILDSRPNAAAIDEQLLHLEALAIQKGDAIGAGFGYPVTVRQVRSWAVSLDLKGYRLAPVSAVLARRAEASRVRVAMAQEVEPTARPSFSSVSASFGGGNDAGQAGGHGGSGGETNGGGGH
jgi:hypothetical protein